MKRCYCGIDIGGTTVKMCLYDADKDELLHVWEVTTIKDSDELVVLNRIFDSLRDACDLYKIKVNELIGIGIGVPGPVTEEGYVLKCVNLDWGIVNLKKLVVDRTGVKNVEIGNDANVAALGEMWRGSAKNYRNIVMVTLGTGVGGGIITAGKIHPGRNGASGEIGHMTIDPDEKELCSCGCRGCLEQFASAMGIVRLAKKMYPNEYSSKNIDAKILFDNARKGDAKACDVVEMLYKYLGIALSNMATVMSPDIFLIGGGVAGAGSILCDGVNKYYNEYAFHAHKDTPIKLASLGNMAGMYGSVKMVLKDSENI